MKYITFGLLITAAVLRTRACSDDEPYGLESREPNTTCIVEGSPDDPPTMMLERAFPLLSFNFPVFMTSAGDGSGRLFVVEQGGLIRVFPNDDAIAAATTFLDVKSKVNGGTEMGLLGLAFHPDYATNGLFYINYTAPSPLRTVVSRFKVDPNDPDRADPGSELVLLEILQPYNNSKAGTLRFGPDGYLYISTGDGGNEDAQGNGQDLTDLLGSILRIDVDNPSEGRPYGIPADNPFADATDGRQPEIFAWGFRNPWQFSFDPVDGTLWAGDVGQESQEEIDIVQSGQNYGWSIMEGNACKDGGTCDQTGLTAPLLAYKHSEGRCVIGGYVYRGDRLPELYGRYIYGDHIVGRIWALSWDGQLIESNAELLDSDYKLTSFGEDERGEIYVVAYSGELFKLQPAGSGTSTAKFPTTLSATGCFSDTAARIPAPGVYAYDVNSHLWADYCGKTRYFALPGVDRMDFTESGAWVFPNGTVTLKDFYIEEEIGNPATRRLLETRLFVKQSGRWSGYTYKWLDDQSDAVLLEDSLTQSYTLIGTDGAPITYTHYYPSRYDCQDCHNQAAGGTLGLQTGQMNRDFDYSGVVDNQLRSYDHIELFTSDVPGPYEDYPFFPPPTDTSYELELRARSYLHANCSHCHQPGGSAVSTMDLRFETALADINACNVPPSQGDLGVSDAMLIVPGHPEKSILSLRPHATDANRMPPIATSVVDVEGLQVLDAWISGLTACP